MKGYEIERKYLLRPCSPKRFLHKLGLTYRKYFIQQYYLPEQNGIYIRYRRKDDAYFKTVKSGEGMVREESEHPVEREEFEAQLKRHTGAIIEKERFVFVYHGLTYEMDRFLGVLAGLCYLEIEFDEVEGAEHFVLPEIFSPLLLAEVTSDKRFNNASLSKTAIIPSLDTHLEVLIKRVTHAITAEESGARSAIVPFESTGVAIHAVLQDLSATLEKRAGVLARKSDDSNTLHQFRVSLRKIRSLLALFKSCFLPQWYQLHQRNLSYLIAQTNSKRDIDVLLERMPRYRSLLPQKFHKGLAPLRKLLLKKQESLVLRIQFLTQSELLPYEVASLIRPKLLDKEVAQPIVITAMHILDEQTGKIIKKGKRLNAKSEEEAYHKLRIQFKKIRYFIEAMKPLIEIEKYKKAQKKIKEMQIILGDFHDYQMQKSLLITLTDDPMLQTKKARKTIKKLLQLIEALEEKQERRFRKKFKKIRACEKVFGRLFEIG